MSSQVRLVTGAPVTRDQVDQLVAQACPAIDYKGKRILLIVPDDAHRPD